MTYELYEGDDLSRALRDLSRGRPELWDGRPTVVDPTRKVYVRAFLREGERLGRGAFWSFVRRTAGR